MLELRHVGFETDDNKEILRDVSLTVQDRFVAITGPNGGGIYHCGGCLDEGAGGQNDAIPQGGTAVRGKIQQMD